MVQLIRGSLVRLSSDHQALEPRSTTDLGRLGTATPALPWLCEAQPASLQLTLVRSAPAASCDAEAAKIAQRMASLTRTFFA